jgi:hypothetical protein
MLLLSLLKARRLKKYKFLQNNKGKTKMPHKTFAIPITSITDNESLPTTLDKKINEWEKENSGKIKIISSTFSTASYSGISIGTAAGIIPMREIIFSTQIYYEKV